MRDETILTTLLEDAWDEVQNMCDTWVYEELGAEFDRLAAELDRVKYDRSVKHDMAAEQIDELTKELDRYKQGVEVEGETNALSGIWVDDIRLQQYFDLVQRVRVMVMKVEEER